MKKTAAYIADIQMSDSIEENRKAMADAFNAMFGGQAAKATTKKTTRKTEKAAAIPGIETFKSSGNDFILDGVHYWGYGWSRKYYRADVYEVRNGTVTKRSKSQAISVEEFCKAQDAWKKTAR